MLLYQLLLVSLVSQISAKFEITNKGRRLSAEENQKLQKMCGMPVKSSRGFAALYGLPRSASDAPFAASFVTATQWHPKMSDKYREKSQWGFCSGSLISSRHVLTAAHCLKVEEADCTSPRPLLFKRRNLARLRIYVGGACAHPQKCREVHMEDTLIMRKVERVFLPSSYHGNQCGQNNGGDIAIVELDKDVPFGTTVYPICLSDNIVGNDTQYHVSGFGFDDAQGSSLSNIGVLKTTHGETQIKCSDDYINPVDTFCTQSNLSFACGGDSGAGIYSRHGISLELEGVVQSGRSCGNVLSSHNKGLVGTSSANTAVFNHLLWICQTTGICVSDQWENTVAEISRLPPSSRPELAIELGPLSYEEMFV